MPLRSLKRSSPCGALTVGVADGDAVAAGVAGAAEATEISDEELPHNSRTADETGWVRSPDWNSERKVGSAGAEFVVPDAEAVVTGAAERTSGKLDRKVALSIDGAAGDVLANAVPEGKSPTQAIAPRVRCELAAAV